MTKTLLVALALLFAAHLNAQDPTIEKISTRGIRWFGVYSRIAGDDLAIHGSVRHSTRMARGHLDHVDYVLKEGDEIVREGTAVLSWRGKSRYPRHFSIDLEGASRFKDAKITLAFHTREEKKEPYVCPENAAERRN